ncbi:ABC transporter substrate-binding protein [Palleronia sp. LCG004]|uniref:ABC transporter substrate-binding protein n=1 Tax=Palleronia sp. LCG004 TaxID=3079304 RepID=UPI002941D88A|nr:ABC transporter substrate-binding protein [Palleronia sp. LCG004]WOI57868.1 ABC transporter substrate-binding protein [Palleronia sp. LCG004]
MKNLTLPSLAAVTALMVLPATAQETTELRASLIPIFDVIPYHAAEAQDYFAQNGLTMNDTPSQGGATGIPALLSGSVDIVFTNIVSILQGLDSGLPLQIIAPAQKTQGTEPDNAGIVARSDAQITSGADLTGKRVGVNTRNNIIWLYARHWIDATGGDSSQVTFVEVPFPQMPDAVLNDQIDAAFVSQPFLGRLMQDDAVEVVGWPYGFEDTATATSFYVVTDMFAEENPEAVDGFVQALEQGIDWTNENYGDEAAIELVSGYTQMDPAVVSAIMETPWQYSAEIDTDSIEKTMNLMVTYELIDAPVDVDAAIRTQSR